MENKPPRRRGRPKSLDRIDVLSIAMQSLWRDGQESLSVNEICRTANVSKPALYREFGSEDGLLAAVLKHYYDTVLGVAYTQLEEPGSFVDVMSGFIDMLTQGTTAMNFPAGCLFTNFRHLQRQSTPETLKQMESIRAALLNSLSDFATRCLENGSLDPAYSATFAAHYLDAQLSNLMWREWRGEDTETSINIAKLAVQGLAVDNV